ncbi:MAG: TetR/AcrR family transcriptional regulator [Actinobacteria bacterium]|nr:TetR/AcrR family transcriptional regulator [Actinomycetota bacterium]
MTEPVVPAPANASGARGRIVDAAYDLFSRRGIRAVGINAIVTESGVAKMTLYRNFASKDELVLEFLRVREQRWTRDWLQDEVARRAETPGDRLLAIFDVFHDWFQLETFEGCSFVNVLLEITEGESAVRRASVEHLATIRSFVAGLAREFGVDDPDAFSRQWHILMKGSIVSAGEGDREAARRARRLGELLLADVAVGR